MPISISAPINPGERHIATAIVVDTSTSMLGHPIEELNQGLIEFGNALKEDTFALGRAEVCVISFNSTVQTEQEFSPAIDYNAPVLEAGGLTVLNEAIDVALDTLEERKELYRQTGIDYYRPWLFILTDGSASDKDKEDATKARLKSAITNNKVVYMPMGIGENADTAKLQEYYPDDAQAKTVLKADAKHFKEAFVWLSKSVIAISNSDPKVSNQVQLPPTPSVITVGI